MSIPVAGAVIEAFPPSYEGDIYDQGFALYASFVASPLQFFLMIPSNPPQVSRAEVFSL